MADVAKMNNDVLLDNYAALMLGIGRSHSSTERIRLTREADQYETEIRRRMDNG